MSENEQQIEAKPNRSKAELGEAKSRIARPIHTKTLNIVLSCVFIMLQITTLTAEIMRIEKSTEIRKPSSDVFNYLKFTRNQDNFSVWNMADPGMKKEQSGTDGEVGFIYRWDSQNKNVGAGEQETTAIIQGKRIDSAIRFFRPMKNTGKTSFVIDDAGNGLTRVNWIFDSPSKFPMVLFAPIFKKMLGKDLEKGLVNLKTILEGER